GAIAVAQQNNGMIGAVYVSGQKEVELAVVVEVGDENATFNALADGILDGGSKGAVAVAQQHVDGPVGGVSLPQVRLAVAIEIAGCNADWGGVRDVGV